MNYGLGFGFQCSLKIRNLKTRNRNHRHLPASKWAQTRCRGFFRMQWSKVAEALRNIGYAHVTLDLQGYRRGSLNETSGSSVSFSAPREAGNVKL